MFIDPDRSIRALSLKEHLQSWLLALVAIALVLGMAACGGDGDSDNNNDVDRGPTTIATTASLNGLYWDADGSKLYLTDDSSNALRVWDGSEGFSQSAALPDAPASGATLGQIVRASDGVLYVTRFGFGVDGTVIAVSPAGDSYNLTGLDATRRRIGLANTPDGSLIVGWFIKGGSGALSELLVDGSQAQESELVTGLGKPVGVTVVGDRLLVSDQNSGHVLEYSLSAVRANPATAEDGKVLATFTTLDGIDLMAAASDGTLYFGGSGGSLFALDAAGKVSVLASGWPKLRGVSVDEANRRIFVAAAAVDEQSTPSLRIVPMD